VLLEYGAGLEDRSRDGLTALHYAVRSGKLPLIALLLERGADPNARDNEGLTPLLHLARTRTRLDPIAVLELLVSHGADVNALDGRGNTLLMFYAKQGSGAPVRWLVERGADPSVKNRAGKTAADLAGPHSDTAGLLR
jgi:ankyrin repeat protein